MRWVCKSAFPSVAAVRRRLSSSAALLASSSTSILPLSPKERIVYITDIEGDFEYWQRYLVNSSVLKSSTSNKHASSSKPSLPPSTLELEDNVHLVYGGDVCDRGYGDLRILQDLISLKERYPRQVHFVLGNRDINKLRLFFALNPLLLQHVHANTYWTSRNEQSRKQAMEDVQAGDAIGKLKWILGKTMGAPIAFKCRQQELQTLSSSIEEDDHAVVKSYLQSMDPENGLLMKFLSYGQISLILGDNLFVHGAIHDYNMGYDDIYLFTYLSCLIINTVSMNRLIISDICVIIDGCLLIKMHKMKSLLKTESNVFVIGQKVLTPSHNSK